MTDDDVPATTAPLALRLFVAGGSILSRRAIENLRRICAEHVVGPFDLEVVDIYQQAQLAERCQIVAVPTLIKLRPEPARRVVGDLSDARRVLRGLDLPRPRADGDDA